MLAQTASRNGVQSSRKQGGLPCDRHLVQEFTETLFGRIEGESELPLHGCQIFVQPSRNKEFLYIAPKDFGNMRNVLELLFVADVRCKDGEVTNVSPPLSVTPHPRAIAAR